MSMIGDILRRVLMLLRGDRFTRELDEEMLTHREMKRRELRDVGASDEDARYAANRAFGNALALRERSHDAWGWRWLEDSAQDLRFGLRMLRKNPGFASVAALTLALGIGANTTVFSLVHAVLLRPLPFPNAKRVVLIHGRTDQVPRIPVSYADLEDFRRQSQSFDGISAWAGQSINLTGQEKPERVRGAFVSANFFDVLGVTAEYGRTFAAGEDQPGSAGVVVVNHSLWVRRFGADPNFVGKPLILNGSVFTVAGILPEGFDFPLDPDRNEIWVPWNANPYFSQRRDHYNLFGIAKLKDGVTTNAAQAEMATIAKRLAQQYPDEDGQRTAMVRPLQEVVVEDLKTQLLILLGAVALVLLIACANVVNLLLARGAARRAEISLRATLGASRARLARQMLGETLALWLVAGALGLLIGAGGLKIVLATSPVRLPPGSVAEIGWPVMLLALLLTGATAVVAGLAPALQYTRGDVEPGLRSAGRGAAEGPTTSRLRGVLLIAQAAMSVVLLSGAGLMMRTIANLTAVQPGFQPKNLLTLEYRLPQTEYSRPADQWNFHQRVVANVLRIPGVRSASVATGIPFTGNIDLGPFVLLDRAAPPPGQEPVAQSNSVDSRYFDTMGIPLLEGRGFAESDAVDAPRVVVINRTLAEQFWGTGDAIGRQLELLDEKKPATIVGVVADVRQDRIDEKPQPQIYFAYAQAPITFATLIVRTEFDAMSFVGQVRDAVWSADKNQPVWKVRTMEGVIHRELGDRRYLAYLLSIYASLATFLAAVGIYGVLSYSVNQRAREIGVRMALGAQPKDALTLFVGDGMKKVGLGIVLGLAGALVLERTLSGMLYGVGPSDPTALACAIAVLTLAALLACWIPARRATRLDPMQTLQSE